MATRTEIAKVYVAIFGRAADADGLAYWISDGTPNTTSLTDLEDIAAAMTQSAEYQAEYAGLDREALVTAMYQNLFDRTPDAEGLDCWVNGDGANVPVNKLIIALINGAQDDDAVIMDNKATVGLEFADAGLNDTTLAKTVMEGVTADPTTVTAAESTITEAVNNIPGQTFVLTNSNNQTTGGIDNIVGTDHADTFIGTAGAGIDNASFNTGDIVDGKAGNDTLLLTTSGIVNPVTVKNVENIKLQAIAATTFNANSVTASDNGLTFNSDFSSADVTVQNINTAADFKLSNEAGNTFEAVFAPSLVAGTDDNANITVENAGLKDNNSNFVVNNTEKITVTSSGTVKNYLDVGSDNNNTAGNYIAANSVLKTVVIKGDQAIDINTGSTTTSAFATTVTTVDASANTAGVNFSIDGDNGALDIKGSSADDKVTLTTAGNLNSQDKIDLGEGTDTLVVAATPGSGADISGVEVLGISNTATGGDGLAIDASKVSGIEKVTILKVENDGNADALTINNAPTTVEADYSANGFGALTINPAVANQDYTLIVNNNPTTGKTDGVDLGANGVTLNSAKSITIDSIGGNAKLNSDTADIVNGTKYNQVELSTTADSVKLTGDTNLKFSTTSTTVATIDASEFTGGVQVTTQTAKAKTITTGSGNDVVDAEKTEVTQDDYANTIKTGAGDDWIVIADLDGLSKKDVIDGGEGSDALVVGKDKNVDWSASTLSSLNGVSNVEKIALDISNSRTLQLGDTAMSAFGDNVTVVNYTPSQDDNTATVDTSAINSKTATVTTDFSSTTGTSTLTYTAGANIDKVTGTKNSDIFNITDTKLGASDSFDGGAGDDILNLTLTGSGDSTDYAVLSADSLANVKSLEKVVLNVNTNDYAKVVIDNDFAVNNQKATTNTLTISTVNALTQDFLTVDASAVSDVQLSVDATNFAAKHVSVTTGSANDTLDIAPSATSVSVTNTTVDFGDGTDAINVSADSAGGALTATLTGSTFTNYEAISMDNSAHDVTVVMDADDISGKAIKVTENTADNSSTLQIEGASSGASANDTIDLTKLASGSNVDSIAVNGNGGDDTIKLSSTLAIATTVTGGAGDDSITLGAGADTVVFGATAAANGSDTITSFTSGTDKLDVSAFFETAGETVTSTGNIVITADGGAVYTYETTRGTVALTGDIRVINGVVYTLVGQVAGAADSVANAITAMNEAATITDTANTAWILISDDNSSAIYEWTGDGKDKAIGDTLTLVGTIDSTTVAGDLSI